MKKVLIISRIFPMWHGGNPRVLGLAKYLPEFGWHPIVLTTHPEEKPDGMLNMVETDHREVLGFLARWLKLNPSGDLRKQVREWMGVTGKRFPLDFFLTRVGEIVNYPDSDKGWKPFAIKAGTEVVRREKIQAMISSSSPVTAHIIAKELKLRNKILWVSDLRDLWSQNHNYSYSPLRRALDQRLEVGTLASANSLVTVSELWAQKLASLHKGKRVDAIRTGFDPADMNIPPANLTPKFTVTYTGSLYSEKQHVSKLFVALKNLVRDGIMKPDDVEVRFYTSEKAWLRKEAADFGLAGIVKQYGLVPRRVAIQKQRESQVLLELDWEAPGWEGSLGLKLFEYLAALRPILASGRADSYLMQRMLNETKAGVYNPNAEDVANSLKEFYQEYQLRGRVEYKGRIEKLSQYSQREMAKTFSGILDFLQENNSEYVPLSRTSEPEGSQQSSIREKVDYTQC